MALQKKNRSYFCGHGRCLRHSWCVHRSSRSYGHLAKASCSLTRSTTRFGLQLLDCSLALIAAELLFECFVGLIEARVARDLFGADRHGQLLKGCVNCNIWWAMRGASSPRLSAAELRSIIKRKLEHRKRVCRFCLGSLLAVGPYVSSRRSSMVGLAIKLSKNT